MVRYLQAEQAKVEIMNKKTIWLINQYAMPPQYESRLRTIKFAQYLKVKGYDVTIFASSIMHNMDIDLIEGKESYIERDYDNLHFVHIKANNYQNNGVARIISSFQFHWRLVKLASKFNKPDVIVQTALVPFGNVVARLAKKTGARYIVEVLDLWPNSLVELRAAKASNPVIKYLYHLEYEQYQHADELVFSQEGGPDYLSDRKWYKDQGGKLDREHVYYINNGVDLHDFEVFKKEYVLEDEDLKNDSVKKVIYIGSIRFANNVGSLIDAAKRLQDLTDVKILIYGNGDDRPALEKRCKDESINNVVFKQTWIDPKYVPYVLSKSYVNILNYMPGQFGTYGGSQSKMFQYMASGHPICCNLEMMYCPIKKHDIGIAKVYADADAYASAIRLILTMPKDEYEAMCNRARKAAEKYDYQVLVDKLVKLF